MSSSLSCARRASSFLPMLNRKKGNLFLLSSLSAFSLSLSPPLCVKIPVLFLIRENPGRHRIYAHIQGQKGVCVGVCRGRAPLCSLQRFSSAAQTVGPVSARAAGLPRAEPAAGSGAAGNWDPLSGLLPSGAPSVPREPWGQFPPPVLSAPSWPCYAWGFPLLGHGSAPGHPLPPSVPPVLRLLSGCWRQALQHSQASSPAPAGHAGLGSLCGCRLVGFISEQDLTPVRPCPPRLPCRCWVEARVPRVSCRPT